MYGYGIIDFSRDMTTGEIIFTFALITVGIAIFAWSVIDWNRRYR